MPCSRPIFSDKLAPAPRDFARSIFTSHVRFGGSLEAPLVFDVPHNVVFREGDRHIHRKGATPVHEGQPVLIPGSMGHPSYLLEGLR